MGGRDAWSPRMPRFRRAVIERTKIRDYLLSPKNPNGKAAYFKSLGYTTRNADKFKRDILNGLKHNKAFVEKPNARGDIAMSVRMELGVTRRDMVVTGWILEAG